MLKENLERFYSFEMYVCYRTYPLTSIRSFLVIFNKPTNSFYFPEIALVSNSDNGFYPLGLIFLQLNTFSAIFAAHILLTKDLFKVKP